MLGISTSGTSKNILAALHAANDRGCVTIAFTGESMSPCSELAQYTFHAPSKVTARIQECHLLMGHLLCDFAEQFSAA